MNQPECLDVDWLAVAGVILTTGAVIFAAVQTYLGRRALLRTEEALRLSHSTRQLELLERLHYVIALKVRLEMWLENLRRVDAVMARYPECRDRDSILQISQEALASPKNLVDRHFYETAPQWAVELMLAGAAHFYTSFSAVKHVWNEKEMSVRESWIPDLRTRFQESVRGVEGLLKLIAEAIPEAVLRSPASVREEDFLTD